MKNDLVGKKVVVALGGNALGDSPDQMVKLLGEATGHLTEMIKEGINLVITHGNGPQVGIIDEAFVVASKDPKNLVPFMPLTDCNAMSQGYIGAQLTRELMNHCHDEGIDRPVVDVPTHVVVDANDPAFKDFEKPIGAEMTEAEAKEFAKATGCQVKPDSGRGWRRVVASPDPKSIVELKPIRDLVEAGCIVVACGGAGIPVVVKDGKYETVEAITDKDLVSSILASKIEADVLILLTAVDKVYLNFNKPDQKALDTMTAAKAKEYMQQGQFAPGSMLPKVEACVKFVEAHPDGKALITSLGHAAAGLRGETGTMITA